MASPRQVRAGAAYVELHADDSKLVRGLRRAESRMKAFGSAVSGIGAKMMAASAAIAAPLAIAARTFAGMGDELAKASDKTGVAVEQLSELRYAAEQSGVAFEGLQSGLRNMARTITDARSGAGAATALLDELGISVEELDGLDPSSQFKRIADAIAGIADPTKRSALAMRLFGRSGVDMLPMLLQGADGIEQLQQAARDLGITMTTEDARAAEYFTDRMADLGKVIKATTFQIGAALAPVLVDGTKKITEFAKEVIHYVKANRDLISDKLTAVVRWAAYTAAVGASLIVVGKMIGALGALVGAIRGVTAAVTLLMAHPMVAVFAAAAAAVVALGYAMQRASIHAADLSNEMERQRKAGDDLRRTDRLRLERLGQLADAEKLNAAEMAEARELIGQLEGRYGDLGAVLDETTNKLHNMANAHRRVADAMRESALAELDKEIAELSRNFEELQKEKASRAGSMVNRLWQGVKAGPGGVFGDEMGDIHTLDAQQSALMARLQDLQRRRRGVLGGDVDAVTDGVDDMARLQNRINQHRAQGVDLSEEDLQAQQDMLRAAEELARLEEQQAARRRDRWETERHEIDRTADRQQALLNQMIQGELALPEPNMAEVQAMNAQIAQIEEQRQNDISALAERAERERLDAMDTEFEQRRAFLLDLRREAARARGDVDEVRRLTADMWASDQIQRALTLGLTPQEWRETMAQIREVHQQMKQVNDAMEAMDSASARGTFQGAAAERLGAAGEGVQRQQLAYAKETAQNTRRLLDRAQTGGLAFA